MLHPGLDQIGLHRFMLSGHNTDGNPAVNTRVMLFGSRRQIMYLLDDVLRHRHLILHQLSNEIKGLHVVFQRDVVDCRINCGGQFLISNGGTSLDVPGFLRFSRRIAVFGKLLTIDS